MEVEVRVVGLVADVRDGSKAVLLESLADKSKGILIWIGESDARAIFYGLNRVLLPRPMTHDLFKTLIDVLQASVPKVVVTELEENTYHASVFLESNNLAGLAPREFDSRPSDAIALAVRCNSKVFVNEALLGDINALFKAGGGESAVDDSADLANMDPKKMYKA